MYNRLLIYNNTTYLCIVALLRTFFITYKQNNCASISVKAQSHILKRSQPSSSLLATLIWCIEEPFLGLLQLHPWPLIKDLMKSRGFFKKVLLDLLNEKSKFAIKVSEVSIIFCLDFTVVSFEPFPVKKKKR